MKIEGLTGEINPCHCGSENLHIVISGDKTVLSKIACDDCGRTVFIGAGETIDDMVDNWNRTPYSVFYRSREEKELYRKLRKRKKGIEG